MKYELEYVATEYKHGWSVWIKRNSQKFMIASALETEVEVYQLINDIQLGEVERYVPKEDIKVLEKKLKELEKYKELYEDLANKVSILSTIGFK
jgi:hypothetical protein